jgi:hypothetical protein
VAQYNDAFGKSFSTESPDEVAQVRIGQSLSDYAGEFMGDSYPAGKLTDVVYFVEGGMEDWAYAAGWDVGASQPCTPSSFGGYPRSKTAYAETGHADAFRAFNILVETADAKRPQESRLGTDEALFQVSGPGDGHVPRNLRLAAQLIDVVQPYVHNTAVDAALVGGGGSRRLHDGVGGVIARVWRSLLQLWPAAPRSLATPRDFRECYQRWVTAATCGAAAQLNVTLGWDVGGGYVVDFTHVRVGVWDASVSPSVLGLPVANDDSPGA